MKTKNIQDVVAELVTKIDDIQKKYWNEHTVTPQDEDITKELTTTLTQYQQDLMSEVVEKLEKKRGIVNTCNDTPGTAFNSETHYNNGYNQAITEAQNIIKSLSK